MRLYFKGVVVGTVVVVVLLLMAHRHFKAQPHALSTDGGKKGLIRQTAGSGERLTAVTHRKKPAAPESSRKGGATSVARGQVAEKAPSPQSSDPEESPSAKGDQRRPPSQPAQSDGDAKASGDSAPHEDQEEEEDKAGEEDHAAVAAPAATEPASAADVSRDATRDATPAAAGASLQRSDSEVGNMKVPVVAKANKAEIKLQIFSESVQLNKSGNMKVPVVAKANKAEIKMDIRTVDPLSATEPLVIRQQEAIDQQEEERLGYQPWRGRPKPPEKLQDPSQAWLTDMKYPKWYTESVVRSQVHGKERDFVGGDPLFGGPCPGAEEDKTRLQTEGTPIFPYIEPGEFIPNSKNPCWHEDPVKKKQMRCLPYFYVAGVAKCGTTDLYKRIRIHPDIMEGELKEYHWWDRLRYGAPMELKFTENSEKNDRPLPLSVYSRIIMGEEVELMKQELRKNYSERICGDGSPAYLWDPKQWYMFEGNQGCTEPRVVIGSFIKHAVPQSKIILLFRQPTQRLYSRFLSRRDRSFKGATSKDFHDYVVRGLAMYKGCFQRFSIRQCAYNRTLYDEAEIRIIEGLYSVFMEDWLRIFKREQILVLRNEDYSEDIEGHIMKVFNFLGVAKLEKNQMRPILTHVSTNIGQNYGKVGPMLPETIAVLNEFYKPFVLRLYELLGDERFLWKDIAVT